MNILPMERHMIDFTINKLLDQQSPDHVKAWLAAQVDRLVEVRAKPPVVKS